MAFRWEQVLTKIVLAVIVGFIFVIASVVTYAVVTDLIGEKRPEQVEEDFFGNQFFSKEKSPNF